MTVQPYTYTGENSSLDKQLTPIGDPLTLSPYGAVDLLRPVFVLSYSAALAECNYIQVTDTGRYYFVYPTRNIGGELVFTCEVDPLYSFAEYIIECNGIIHRSESVGAPSEFIDTMLPVLPDGHDNTGVIATNSELTESGDYCYILTVLGGA